MLIYGFGISILVPHVFLYCRMKILFKCVIYWHYQVYKSLSHMGNYWRQYIAAKINTDIWKGMLWCSTLYLIKSPNLLSLDGEHFQFDIPHTIQTSTTPTIGSQLIMSFFSRSFSFVFNLVLDRLHFSSSFFNSSTLNPSMTDSFQSTKK